MIGGGEDIIFCLLCCKWCTSDSWPHTALDSNYGAANNEVYVRIGVIYSNFDKKCVLTP